MVNTQDLVDVDRDVVVGIKLGEGNYGEVYKGVWHNSDIVLKSPKANTGIVLKSFNEEINVMKRLNHPHIVRYLGTYLDENDRFWMIVEYLEMGSLEDFFKKSDLKFSVLDYLRMCSNAAAGMIYLSEKSYIHRDLALRNLLLEKIGSEDNKDTFIVKISDFGLSKMLDQSDYYKSTSSEIPLRWCSTEIVEKRVFSTKSDVWAFGVTMWEIFSRGLEPYTGMSNLEVLKKIKDGGSLTEFKPDATPDTTFDLMKKMWHAEPSSRPTFQEIGEELLIQIKEHSSEESVVGITKNS